jgi:hypothetical protein
MRVGSRYSKHSATISRIQNAALRASVISSSWVGHGFDLRCLVVDSVVNETRAA